jgi:D-amino-acid dehydrogenase
MLADPYLPATQWGPITEIRRGVRPVCADGMPIMGRLKKGGNVFVAGGHDQKGLSLGPVTGYRLARLLAGKPADELDEWISPQRF